MEIYVFDKAFNPLGIIERFSSLIWKRELYKVGSFELHAFIDDALGLLQKGNILMKDDSPDEAVEIGSITLDDENAGTVVVNGFFIGGFLEERFVWTTQTETGTIEQVMKNFVTKNCITPTDSKRIIPNLIVSGASGITIPATEVNTHGTILLLMEEFAIKYDVGWRVRFDLPNKKYVFEPFLGKDSSIGQTINPHVIFSAEYENVFSQRYMDSNAGYKNMALIGGQGEGPDRTFTTINNNLSGFERRELFVDADDISKEDVNGVVIPPADYIKLLDERGKSKLAELQPIITFESGISILSNLEYRADFDLGDKVTIQNNSWGLVINTRITTVEEVYENNTKDVRVNFGSNIPTIIDKIKKAVG